MAAPARRRMSTWPSGISRSLDQPLTGWFATPRRSRSSDDFNRAEGIRAMLCSTPQMLSMAAFEAALDAFDGITMAHVQAKGRALGDLMIRAR